ncbi:putative dehydrogenase/reductase [Nostocoides japonicum T1-X7]|uniref:Putative dehydrogenase/reductase n=1 Tax=Nostocoides japonicum T1-X7 TaxID=1194083 RepID=A0A077M391_9MICO|nr:SDR family NAD(P)-dependent oxidoreductase [Tetrasphaera japonica]CCH80216.1 putative dehydrogenase/reductase [Tetrasphaera japonica T1-X7]
MRLNGMRAVITGASSGIGQATVNLFRSEGAQLLLTGRRKELPDVGPDELYLSGDLVDEDFVHRLADVAARRFGEVDVVVLCHGLQRSSPLTEMSLEDARAVLDGNLLSTFLAMKHLAPLAPASGASIVCVSSRLGMIGKPEETLYSAAKGGVIALARGAAIEWAPRNIRVNVVAPGLTLTPIIEASINRAPDADAYRRMREESIPLGRMATAEEVAYAIVFLSSHQASHITGAVLPVDGGYTAA